MTILYPLKNQNDYTELMYSLRSIEKFLPEPYTIVIIGDLLPDWITNVTWINVPDVSGRKQFSIRRKILAGLEYIQHGLFMNDDIYFTQPIEDIEHYPYYYWGGLDRSRESGAKPLMNQLQSLGKPIKNFDSNSHYPIVYIRNYLVPISENFGEDCIIKSMYCNYLNIEGVEIRDNKITKAMELTAIRNWIADNHCFSTGTNSLKSVLPILQEMFPRKSKFEL